MTRRKQQNPKSLNFLKTEPSEGSDVPEKSLITEHGSVSSEVREDEHSEGCDDESALVIDERVFEAAHDGVDEDESRGRPVTDEEMSVRTSCDERGVNDRVWLQSEGRTPDLDESKESRAANEFYMEAVELSPHSLEQSINRQNSGPHQLNVSVINEGTVGSLTVGVKTLKEAPSPEMSSLIREAGDDPTNTSVPFQNSASLSSAEKRQAIVSGRQTDFSEQQFKSDRPPPNGPFFTEVAQTLSRPEDGAFLAVGIKVEVDEVGWVVPLRSPSERRLPVRGKLVVDRSALESDFVGVPVDTLRANILDDGVAEIVPIIDISKGGGCGPYEAVMSDPTELSALEQDERTQPNLVKFVQGEQLIVFLVKTVDGRWLKHLGRPNDSKGHPANVCMHYVNGALWLEATVDLAEGTPLVAEYPLPKSELHSILQRPSIDVATVAMPTVSAASVCGVSINSPEVSVGRLVTWASGEAERSSLSRSSSCESEREGGRGERRTAHRVGQRGRVRGGPGQGEGRGSGTASSTDESGPVPGADGKLKCTWCDIQFRSASVRSAHMEFYCTKKPGSSSASASSSSTVTVTSAPSLTAFPTPTLASVEEMDGQAHSTQHDVSPARTPNHTLPSPGSSNPTPVTTTSSQNASSRGAMPRGVATVSTRHAIGHSSLAALAEAAVTRDLYRCNQCKFLTESWEAMGDHKASHDEQIETEAESEYNLRRLSRSREEQILPSQHSSRLVMAAVPKNYCQTCDIQYQSSVNYRVHTESYCKGRLAATRQRFSELLSQDVSPISMELSPPPKFHSPALGLREELQRAALQSSSKHAPLSVSSGDRLHLTSRTGRTDINVTPLRNTTEIHATQDRESSRHLFPTASMLSPAAHAANIHPLSDMNQAAVVAAGLAASNSQIILTATPLVDVSAGATLQSVRPVSFTVPAAVVQQVLAQNAASLIRGGSAQSTATGDEGGSLANIAKDKPFLAPIPVVIPPPVSFSPEKTAAPLDLTVKRKPPDRPVSPVSKRARTASPTRLSPARPSPTRPSPASSTDHPMSESPRSGGHPPRKAISKCEECDIAFFQRSTYLAHKEYYCKARHTRVQTESGHEMDEEEEELTTVSSQTPPSLGSRPGGAYVGIPGRAGAAALRANRSNVATVSPISSSFDDERSSGNREAEGSSSARPSNIAEGHFRAEIELPPDTRMVPTFTCVTCGSTYATAESFRRHVCPEPSASVKELAASGSVLRTCTECSLIMAGDRSAMHAHLKTHVNVVSQTYMCDICGYTGPTAKGVMQHARTSHRSESVSIARVKSVDVGRDLGRSGPVSVSGATRANTRESYPGHPLNRSEEELVRMKNEPYKKRRSRKMNVANVPTLFDVPRSQSLSPRRMDVMMPAPSLPSLHRASQSAPEAVVSSSEQQDTSAPSATIRNTIESVSSLPHQLPSRQPDTVERYDRDSSEPSTLRTMDRDIEVGHDNDAAISLSTSSAGSEQKSESQMAGNSSVIISAELSSHPDDLITDSESRSEVAAPSPVATTLERSVSMSPEVSRDRANDLIPHTNPVLTALPSVSQRVGSSPRSSPAWSYSALQDAGVRRDQCVVKLEPQIEAATTPSNEGVTLRRKETVHEERRASTLIPLPKAVATASSIHYQQAAFPYGRNASPLGLVNTTRHPAIPPVSTQTSPSVPPQVQKRYKCMDCEASFNHLSTFEAHKAHYCKRVPRLEATSVS